MFESTADWLQGVLILMLALATFRKEIIKLLKPPKPVKKEIDIKKTVFGERLFEGKLALNRCETMMGDDFPITVPEQTRRFDDIRYYAFSKGEALIREILTENDFANKYPSSEEYKKFIDKRKVSIIGCISDAIDFRYNDDDFDIQRKVLKAQNMQDIQKYYDVIEDFFWTCRRIEERHIEQQKEKELL